MKKKILAAVAVFALLAIPVIGFGTASAGSFRTGDAVTIAEDKTIDGTLFSSGDTVEIAGTVDGDVFCAAKNVIVTGTVRGDVICAGQVVRVGGVVEGDVRVAGQTVTLNGDIEGNATVAAQILTTEENSTVRDLAVGAETMTLNGAVGRDADFGAAQATLNGMIARDVMADVERLVLGTDSRTTGNVTYISETDAERRAGAQVSGTLDRQEPQADAGAETSTGQIFGGIAFIFLMLLIVSMALVALFPRVLQRVSNNAVGSPGKTALVGLVTLLLAPVVIIGSMASIIGIVLGLFLLTAFVLVLFASGPVFGYYVGRMLLSKNTTNPLLYMLLGSSVVILLYFIPIVGQLTMLAAVLLGTGMIMREVVRRGANPQYDVATMPAKTTKAKK